MAVIYLITNYGKLYKKGETLQFSYGEGTVSTIFPYKTEQLVFIGNVEITGPALKLLMRHKINSVFLNKNGRFNGRLIFEEGKNVLLREKQYKLLYDEVFKTEFAKSIVKGKLKNQLTFMQRLMREKKSPPHYKTNIVGIKKLILDLGKSTTIKQIMGYEGAGAKYFFEMYGFAILQDWAVFKGRSKHPPEDNVNAVLSFLYTLVNYRVEAAIESEGLDPFVGYLHSIDYGRKSLIFDLMEEYRTPIVDTLTASLFNLGILNENDFESVTFSSKSDDYPLDLDEKNENVAFKEQKGVLLTTGHF